VIRRQATKYLGSALICDGVRTGSGSDRVITLSILIFVISLNPVATAPGTDSMTVLLPLFPARLNGLFSDHSLLHGFGAGIHSLACFNRGQIVFGPDISQRP
jgi:hypothetical protein